MLYTLSNLTDESITRIKQVESETGRTLLALSGHELHTASMPDDEVTKVKQLEDDLGVVLLALDPE